MIRRGGLLLGVAGIAACAGSHPPAPVPSPRDSVAVAPSPSPVPAPALPAPPARGAASVRAAFVGDINLGTSTLPDGVPPDSGRGLLDAARPWLTGDLVIGNLEGVLADSGTSDKCERLRAREPAASTWRHGRSRRGLGPADSTAARPGCYAFLTPALLAPRLRESGFTHLNLANNHANDYGEAGRQSTERLLDSLGIARYGAYGRVAVDSVRRGDSLTVVGLIGFSTYPTAYNLLDIDRSSALVDSLRPLVDLLVVTFHGGAEGAGALHVPEAAESLGREPRGELRRWTHAVVDAGADVVVGHGPHVLRGMEFYRGRLIAYSLGNFATYRGFNLEGPLGITGVLQLEFGPAGRLREARLVPMRQAPRRGPAPDPGGAAVQLVHRLSTEDFGAFGARLDETGTVSPPEIAP